jgi:hypothetical protein
MAEGAPRTFSNQAIHLVRTATQANLTLSQMADQKAGILMGATFVVFTISVSQAARGTVPASLLILACFAFLSALCAVAAILPSIRTAPDPDGERNLLFFGVFTAMSEADFADAMLDRLHDDETIFRTMLRDIYQNGQVLQRKKYRLLGWAYRFFLAGLTLTVVTFLFEHRARIGAMLGG